MGCSVGKSELETIQENFIAAQKLYQDCQHSTPKSTSQKNNSDNADRCSNTFFVRPFNDGILVTETQNCVEQLFSESKSYDFQHRNNSSDDNKNSAISSILCWQECQDTVLQE